MANFTCVSLYLSHLELSCGSLHDKMLCKHAIEFVLVLHKASEEEEEDSVLIFSVEPSKSLKNKLVESSLDAMVNPEPTVINVDLARLTKQDFVFEAGAGLSVSGRCEQERVWSNFKCSVGQPK